MRAWSSTAPHADLHLNRNSGRWPGPWPRSTRYRRQWWTRQRPCHAKASKSRPGGCSVSVT